MLPLLFQRTVEVRMSLLILLQIIFSPLRVSLDTGMMSVQLHLRTINQAVPSLNTDRRWHAPIRLRFRQSMLCFMQTTFYDNYLFDANI